MSNLYAVAGAKFFIGDALATSADDLEESDFSAVTWQVVDGWETMGTVGDQAEVITTALINRKRVTKAKGTFDAGEMENTFAIIPGDQGQEDLKAALADGQNYAFKIEFDDPVTVGGTGSEAKFVGLVTNQRRQGGSANTVRMRAFTISINSNIVETAAT